MTAPQFDEWIERKLDLYGNGKVVPNTDRLETKARDILAARLNRARTCGIEEQARAEAEVAELPPIFAQQQMAAARPGRIVLGRCRRPDHAPAQP